jgi:hypothetical protein
MRGVQCRISPEPQQERLTERSRKPACVDESVLPILLANEKNL